jgi:hypothetical protein
MTGDAGTGERDPDERAREAVAHLQRASLEFIDAARALLDVAEEAVREPSGVMAIVAETIGGLAEAVGGAAPAWADRGRSRGAGRGGARAAADPAGPGASQASPKDHPGVEHIRIS